MTALTVAHFGHWLEAYGRASQENDPQASAELFTPEARYFESPFDEPLVGRQAIYDYWAHGARDLTEKTSCYEILAVQGQLGVARWQAQFTSLWTGLRFELDCIFLAEFDNEGLCSDFREWWHPRETVQPAQ